MKITVEAEIDEQKVLDDMTNGEIFEKSGFDASNCKDQFGDSLLKEFTAKEIVDCHGETVFLNEIGEEAAIKYFRIKVAE